jgi:hypothetical protein
LQTFGVDVVARVLVPVGAVTPAVRRSCATDVFDPALPVTAFGVVAAGEVDVTGAVDAPGVVVVTGAAGATGVTEFDALDALPVPRAFVAVTVNV